MGMERGTPGVEGRARSEEMVTGRSSRDDEEMMGKGRDRDQESETAKEKMIEITGVNVPGGGKTRAKGATVQGGNERFGKLLGHRVDFTFLYASGYTKGMLLQLYRHYI